MQNTVLCEIVTPEKLLLSQPAQIVAVPGAEGDFGVLPGHAPFVSSLRPGVIAVQAEGGEKRFAVASGIVEVTPACCTILAERVQDLSNVSGAQAQANLTAARHKLENALTDEQRAEAQAEIALAEAVAAAV